MSSPVLVSPVTNNQPMTPDEIASLEVGSQVTITDEGIRFLETSSLMNMVIPGDFERLYSRTGRVTEITSVAGGEPAAKVRFAYLKPSGYMQYSLDYVVPLRCLSVVSTDVVDD